MARRVIKSVADLHALATELAGELHTGQVLLLYGELGSGKTTFVQGLAKALGIKESVTSPTFVIASEYAVTNHPTITTLAHVDLYRLDETTAPSDPAVRDVLSRATDLHLRQGFGGQAGRLTVIEWADRLGENAPKTAQRISFSHGKAANERILTF